MARLLKQLPFRELGIPLKMLHGYLRNRGKALPAWREQKVTNGSLRLVDGVPLVRVRGTPREMGRALGELTGAQARALLDTFLTVFAPDRAGDLPLAREMQAHMPAWYLDEIAGLADSGAISADDALLGQCFLDIHKVAFCTTIAAHGRATESGETILGRNLDFPALTIAHQGGMVVVYEPAGGRRYAGVTWPGFLGLLTGLNEDGLALAMMLVYGQSSREHLDGQPFPLVFRRVLSECVDVEQAIALLEARPYCTANNVMLADANRHAARMQLHPERAVTTRSGENEPALACTNHYLEAELKRFAFTWFSSTWRLSRVNRAIHSGEVLSVARVKQLLQKTAMGPINLQRAVMLPERRELDVALDRPSSGARKWVKFSRKDLFG